MRGRNILSTVLNGCKAPSKAAWAAYRPFHATSSVDAVKPFLLTDIGEGTRDVQIIQWFVKPGSRVDEFDAICEVQSDKATVEITSPHEGIIKKLHYAADDMALVGKPLVDIDVEEESVPRPESGEVAGNTASPTTETGLVDTRSIEAAGGLSVREAGPSYGATKRDDTGGRNGKKLATPAVRHLSKELSIDIAEVSGTGRDGRVTKEDVQRHAAAAAAEEKEVGGPTDQSRTTTQAGTASPAAQCERQGRNANIEDRVVPLTPVQRAMFKTMTQSLSIPHFLYTTTVDLTALSSLRALINAHRRQDDPTSPPRINALPFIIKAVSRSLLRYPLLNAWLDNGTTYGGSGSGGGGSSSSTDPPPPPPPLLTYRATHDFGLAVDTPQGLLVPVLRDVASSSVEELAGRIREVASRAAEGRLSAAELKGASFTVSNVGSIGARDGRGGVVGGGGGGGRGGGGGGGGVVAPVIVAPQVAILGIVRSRVVPCFGADGEIVPREEVVLSFSADHRVVDGAYAARAAEEVRRLLEGPDGWALELR